MLGQGCWTVGVWTVNICRLVSCKTQKYIINMPQFKKSSSHVVAWQKNVKKLLWKSYINIRLNFHGIKSFNKYKLWSLLQNTYSFLEEKKSIFLYNKCLRTICSKLIWSCNHIQLHACRHTSTPLQRCAHPHYTQSWGSWTNLPSGLERADGASSGRLWDLLFPSTHNRHTSDRIMYFKDHFGILEAKITFT